MGLAVLVARGPRDRRRDGTALLCQDAGLLCERGCGPARWRPTSIQAS